VTERQRKVLYLLICIAAFGVGLVIGIIIFDRVLVPAFTRGGGTISIPDVTGIPVGEAENIAKEGGFAFRIMREEHSDSIPETFVISQRPEAGSPAKKGRRISVVVSLSVAVVQVPDITGQHFRTAQLAIEKTGLKVGEILYENSDSVSKEKVINTAPPSGSELLIGSMVDLIVSTGAEKGLVRVPNFMGQTIEDARELATREGLFLKYQFRKIPSVPENTVYRQGTEHGALVERGSTIYVVVARPDGE